MRRGAGSSDAKSRFLQWVSSHLFPITLEVVTRFGLQSALALKGGEIFVMNNRKNTFLAYARFAFNFYWQGRSTAKQLRHIFLLTFCIQHSAFSSPGDVAHSGSNRMLSITWCTDVTGTMTGNILPTFPAGTNWVYQGDSITTDKEATSGPGNDWPARFAALPTMANSGTNVNVAVNGNILQKLIDNYGKEVHPFRPAANGGTPCVTTIFIGANDLGPIQSGYYGGTVESYYSSLRAHWQTAKKDGMTVIAFTIMPRHDTDMTREKLRQELNALIRSGTDYDFLVDTAALLTDPFDKKFFIDGLHPTPEGNVKIARAVQSAILSKNGSAMPDTTATSYVGKMLRLGLQKSTYTGNLLEGYAVNTGTTTNSGFIVRNDWNPEASPKFNTACVGVESAVFQTGSTNSYGSLVSYEAVATLKGSGTCETIVGYQTHLGNQDDSYGGTNGKPVNTLMHFQATSPVLNGTATPITNIYGLFINKQKAAGVRNAYGVYQAGPEDANYFGGPTTFSNQVVISGTLQLSGTASPPSNTTAPVAWGAVNFGGAVYRVPLYQ